MKRLALILATLLLVVIPGCMFDVGCRDRDHDRHPHFRADVPTGTPPSERK